MDGAEVAGQVAVVYERGLVHVPLLEAGVALRQADERQRGVCAVVVGLCREGSGWRERGNEANQEAMRQEG